MTKLATNRDLYLAVTELTKTKANSQPSLEGYLLSLHHLGMRFEAHDSIGFDNFFSLLRDSFSFQPPQFSADWSHEYVGDTNIPGFPGWLKTISSQIIDLHEMSASGELRNELRYFGIQSPRGAHWVNFDPCSYLECAIAGSIGGWEPEDESGRSYVPGPVTVFDEHNKLVTMNPEDVPRPTYPLPAISWELFRDILRCGQYYE